MGQPFFSIGIIFKNEIRCLERCLKSLQPLRDAVPCELVMADTGSSDGSREIAEKYADILFDFEWIDDFAAARNAVMDRCSGQWYFTIDADEWLTEDIQELIEFSKAKNLLHDLGAVNIHNYNTVELDDTKQYNDFSGIRLLRMSTGIRYTGCIHERWVVPNNDSPKAMMLYNTWLKHDGYAYATKAAEQAKYERNMALLEKKLAQDPDDMQTLVECIDMSKHDTGSIEYARKLIGVINKKPFHWEKFGPVAFRAVVSVGKLQNLPELREWIDQALEWFPNSIFIRVDVAYYALADYFDTGDYAEAVRWGMMYQNALAEYRAGKYDHSELLRGALEYSSPFWDRKVYILLGHAYLETGEPEKAFDSLRSIRGDEIEDLTQVESITQMMMRLHRTAMLDTSDLMYTFWEQIGQPEPNPEVAENRRNMLLRTAAPAFLENYRKEEEGRTESLRHGYGIFGKLECGLGIAAAILDAGSCSEMEKLLGQVEDWDDLPIAALEHALLAGVHLPFSDNKLNIEKMDALAGRMARKDGPLTQLTISAADEDLSDWHSLIWARGLALAAVKSCDWTSTEQRMELCRAFVKIEQEFLPRYYMPDVLNEENVWAMPPLHRFGWYCGKAFRALDARDDTVYVRLLRKGLESYPEMKDMVDFLLKHLEEQQHIQAMPELLTLAEQIRGLLSMYPADDPAVEALKQSEAYQKVAHLIEGPDLGIFGGLPQ